MSSRSPIRTQRGLQTGGHFYSERAHVSLEYNWSHTEENQTVADIDGDGRPDLLTLSGGVIQAQRNNGSGFDPAKSWDGFTLAALDLSNPSEASTIGQTLPLSDTLVTWTAPMTGTVSISGPVQKLANGGPQDDGVTLSIYKNTGPNPGDPTNIATTLLWTTTLGPTNLTPCLPGNQVNGAQPAGSCNGPFTVDVAPGDVISFLSDSIGVLSDSIANTDGDDVAWSPHISYQTVFDGGLQTLDSGQHALLEPWGISDLRLQSSGRLSHGGLAGQPLDGGRRWGDCDRREFCEGAVSG